MRVRASETKIKGEPAIPEIPPRSLRGDYVRLSWDYLRWCTGILVWSLLCVGYFILTRQVLEMVIGICLGVLMLGMLLFPAAFFGGKTWYKRLGWATVLAGLFSVLFVYPLIIVAMGVWQRIAEARYIPFPSLNDTWHLLLSALTVGLSVWTVLLALRAWQLVRQLQRGEYSG